ALEYEVADIVRRAVSRDALRHSSHLFDEIDQAEIEVIFDQGEARNADAHVGTVSYFGERVCGRFLGGGVNEDDLPSLDMCRRLAVGDNDDLLVRGRLPRENAARQPQPRVDIRKVLGNSARGVIQVEAEVNAAVKHADRLGSRV